MATPNADRLHGIESWDTSAIQHANSSLEDVRIALDEIAGINERVAGDLGLEGTTADRVSAKLDSLAKDLKSHAGGIGQLIKVRQEAMQGGIDAKNESADIQAKMAQVNKTLDGFEEIENATKGVVPGADAASQAQARREEAHAEFEKLAVEALHTLRAKTDAAIAGLPFQPKVREALRKGAPATFERIDKHFDSNGVRKKFVEGDSSGGGRSVDTIQPVGPRKSATQWYTPGGDAGSAGGHSAGVPGGGGASLQSSHYTHGSQGTFVPSGGSRASVLDSPSVHNPLAMAASVGGGVVAGYKAYQAVRAGRAALAAGRGVSGAGSMRSGAAVRTPVSSSSGIVRGATTAVRATTSSSSASGRGVPARGGASGVARPISASPARGSIVRGATTAVRATASSSASSRGSGLVRGATTAVRATTSESAGGRGMGAGGRGAASAARSAGSPTTRGTEASGRGSGVSGRAGAGTTSARGGTGSSVRGGSSASGRARAETAGRSGVGRGASSAQPAGGSSVSRGGSSVQGRSAASSSRGAISGLTGRGRGKKDDEERRDEYPPIERTHVSLYETDRTVTFLEAGHPEKAVQDRQDEHPKGHDHANYRPAE